MHRTRVFPPCTVGPCLVKIWNSLSRLFTAQNYKLANPRAVFKSNLSFLLYMFSLTPLPDRFSLINSSIGSSPVANLSEYSLIEFNLDFLLFLVLICLEHSHNVSVIHPLLSTKNAMSSCLACFDDYYIIHMHTPSITIMHISHSRK